MLLHAQELFSAFEEGDAVAAFNVITLEHAESIAAAAEGAGRPVIMQLSQNAIAFHGGPRAIAAGMAAVANISTAPVVLHLDHITDVDLALMTRDLGFSSVMFDGAALPYSDNVAQTRLVAQWGASSEIWVEAELGEVGGKNGVHAPGVRTDPQEAALFVDQTGVDSLAVAVGSSHAMEERAAELDTELIRRIASTVDVPLVLHGSSGVPDQVLAQAVAAGMRKINVGTALNLAFTGAVREWLEKHDASDPRKYIGPARSAMTETCAHFLSVVGQG